MIQDIDWLHINELRKVGERMAIERQFEVMDIATLDDQWTKFYLCIPRMQGAAPHEREYAVLMAENLVGQELLLYPDEAEAKIDQALKRLAAGGRLDEVLMGLPTRPQAEQGT